MQQEYIQAIIKELRNCSDLELLDLILKLLQDN